MAPLEESLLDEAADWLVRLNESTASEVDFEQWQHWLGADPRHAQAFQELEGTWRLSSQAAISHPSPAALARDRYRVEKPVAAWVGSQRRMRRLRYSAATAALVLLAVAGVTWWARQPSVIQTAIAEQRVVSLPDGSRLTVGPHTRVSYHFTVSSRALTLDEGQAFFEVKKAPGRPFVVETGRGRIVAVGTAFSVDVMPDRLNVTVAEGTVRIETGQRPSGQDLPLVGAAVVVSAGRRYVSASGGAQVVALPASAPSMSWREGRLAYYGDPLSAVVTDLNRYAPDRIEFADPELGNLQYTGTVFPEQVGDWLTSLPNAFPVRVERSAHGWLIARRSASPASPATTTP